MEIIRVKHHEVEEETEGEKKNRGGKHEGERWMWSLQKNKE